MTARSPVTSQSADGAVFTNTEAAWEVTCGAWSDGVLTHATDEGGRWGREGGGGRGVWGGGGQGGGGEDGSAKSYEVVL